MVIIIRLQKTDLDQILSSINAPPDRNPPLPTKYPRSAGGMRDNVSSIESTTTDATNNPFYRPHGADDATGYTSPSAATIVTNPMVDAKEENTHDIV